MILSGTASATDYYVSTLGADTSDGLSPEKAWQSPSYAVSKAQSGDTIYLMSGTWYGEHMIFTSSGTKDAPITLTSYNGEVIFDGIDRFDKDGDCYTAIEIFDSTNGLEYININNIIIHNYYRGIYSRNARNIHIDNVEIFNTSFMAVDFVDSHQSSLTNSDIHDNGWNSVSVVANSQSTSDIQILNNKIHDNPGTSGGSGHNLIDLFNVGDTASLKSIDIKDNYLYNSGLSNSAIFEHGSFTPMYNMNVSNNVIYNTKQITLDRFTDSVVSNNTLRDQPGYGFTCLYDPMKNVTFYGNTLTNVSWSELRVKGAPDEKYLLIENNDIYYYRIDDGTASILNPQKSKFEVQPNGNEINVEFTDNTVFTTNTDTKPTFSPTSSSYDISGDSKITFNTYPMTAKPTSSNVNVKVNDFDTSKSLGDVLVEFTASSTEDNNVDFTIGELQSGATYTVKMDGFDFREVTADQEGYISFNNDIWSEHTFTLVQTSESSTSESASTGISFTPSVSSLVATVSESTSFTVDSGQDFTSALWYLNGNQVESDSVNYVQNWDIAGVHTVVFDGTAVAGTISRTWTVVVSESEISEASTISISPSSTVVEPGDSFTIDVYIDPTQSLTGSQFDLYYSQLASVSSAHEGDLFTLSNLSTTFGYESIDNTIGILNNVYSAILGCGTISTPGTMTTINMVAGSNTGILDIGLSGVILSDVDSNPAPCAESNATILIDTAPELVSISEQSVDEEQNLSFIICATDRDGDDLTYSATSLPNDASFNTGTATFSWSPSEDEAGAYTAMFEVTDGYLIDSMSVPITVNPLNHAPVISFFEPSDAASSEEGTIVNVNVAATDEDEQSLSYVIKIDDLQVATGPNYAWNVNYESAGTHTIEVIVSDGIDDVRATSTITIIDLQPRWDVNEDGIVNVLDVTLVAQNYGMTYTGDLPRYDVNQDGTIDLQDLSVVAGHFGEIV